MSLLQETLHEIRRLTGRMKLYPKNNPPTSYSVTIYTYNGGYFVSYNGYDLSVLTDNPTDSMITFGVDATYQKFYRMMKSLSPD